MFSLERLIEAVVAHEVETGGKGLPQQISRLQYGAQRIDLGKHERQALIERRSRNGELGRIGTMYLQYRGLDD